MIMILIIFAPSTQLIDYSSLMPLLRADPKIAFLVTVPLNRVGTIPILSGLNCLQ